MIYLNLLISQEQMDLASSLDGDYDDSFMFIGIPVAFAFIYIFINIIVLKFIERKK